MHALELLGATFVDKKHDMLSAYGYWRTALERRAATASGELAKERTVRHSPIEAYEFATEFVTQRELDEIIADPDDMRMQALLIRERILGKALNQLWAILSFISIQCQFNLHDQVLLIFFKTKLLMINLKMEHCGAILCSILPYGLFFKLPDTFFFV